jgi:hypothetical protein
LAAIELDRALVDGAMAGGLAVVDTLAAVATLLLRNSIPPSSAMVRQFSSAVRFSLTNAAATASNLALIGNPTGFQFVHSILVRWISSLSVAIAVFPSE